MTETRHEAPATAAGRTMDQRRSIPRGLPAILCLAAIGCRGAADTAVTRQSPATQAAPAAAASEPSPTHVTLTPEALRQAGILTEVVHPQPFAVTLSLLARLSPVAETSEELEARLAYQTAATRERRTTQELERVRKLAADNVVASKTLQGAEADAAEARLERLRAETALRNLGLEAAKEPDYAAADLWALADLYGGQASQVTPGASAWIHVDSLPDETFPARVVSLARFLKPQTRTLTVRIAITDPKHRLRPQDIATAEVQVAQKSALSVPDSALLFEGADRILFVGQGDGFERTRVQVGAQQAGRAEITAGLGDGQVVVTRGAQFLLGELYKVRTPHGAEDD